MRKNYNLKVELQTGTEFLVKVGVDNVGELCAWLAGMESVREYGVSVLSIQRLRTLAIIMVLQLRVWRRAGHSRNSRML